VDEKTGIQALKRIHEGQPMKAGYARRIEYEYQRNGTICLMAAINVGQSQMSHHRLHPTRTEKDFLLFIQQTVRKYPQEDQVIIMADQLNTHLSASLVEWIADRVGFQGELGKKNHRGILKNKESRKTFLEETTHRIRFVYTPKHCSWLNPIENWFAKLQRHVIRYGDFESVENLSEKITRYIDFYNQCLAKPFHWKFKGFKKDKSNCSST
jgi:transposase